MTKYDVTAVVSWGSNCLDENAKVRNNWDKLLATISGDHYPMDDALDGYHKKITLVQGEKPNTAILENTGFIYSKFDYDGEGTDEAPYRKAELFYEDEDNNEIQLTKNGVVASPASNSALGVSVAWAFVDENGKAEFESDQLYNLTVELIEAPAPFKTYTFTFSDKLSSGMSSANYCIIASTTDGQRIIIDNKTEKSFSLIPLNGIKTALAVSVYGTPA